MNRSVLLHFSFLSCLLLCVGPWVAVGYPAESVSVTPATAGGEPDDQGWKISAAFYLWLTAMSGDMTVGGKNVPIDISLSDLLDASDHLIGFFGYCELRKGRFGFGLDSAYAHLWAEDLSGQLVAAGPTQINLEGAEWDFKLYVLDFAGFYRFHEVRQGNESTGATGRPLRPGRPRLRRR